MNTLEWVMSGDTGTSSMTIMHVMEGTAMPEGGVGMPLDVGDFGRCFRLLEAFPEYRARLGEVATAYPEWSALVREWDNLSMMYEADHPSLASTLDVLVKEGADCHAAPASCDANVPAREDSGRAHSQQATATRRFDRAMSMLSFILYGKTLKTPLSDAASASMILDAAMIVHSARVLDNAIDLSMASPIAVPEAELSVLLDALGCLSSSPEGI